MIHHVQELPVEGARVFVRVDYNVAFDADGTVASAARIVRTLPTIKHLMARKARIILASHLGRPKGKPDACYSLVPVGEKLAELTGAKVILPEDCVGDVAKHLAQNLHDGEILLLENLRFHAEEETNDPQFAKLLAQLADVYVTDAFGAMHRAHASTVGMVRHFEHRGIGFLVADELKYLGPLVTTPARPFVTVLGGVKVSDKIGLLENLLARVDVLLIGGAMANTFLKARGHDVGDSFYEADKLRVAQNILDRAASRNVKVLLPVDCVLAKDLESTEMCVRTVGSSWQGLKAFDIGPETAELFAGEIARAATVFWNGPMGVFENPLFAMGSLKMAQAVADCAGVTVVGGGDSLAAVEKAGVESRIKHLSTGGGASLRYLEGVPLPGLEVLEK